MDGLNINGIVQGLLENPQMMQSIMGLLGNLNNDPTPKNNGEQNINKNNDQNRENNSEQSNSTEKSQNDLSAVISLLSNSSSKKEDDKTNGHPCPSDRKALLLALKPFLGKERRDKVDFILNILSLLDVAESLGFTNFKI